MKAGLTFRPPCVCYSMSGLKSQGNVQSAEVTVMLVAEGFYSLAICHQHIWTHEIDTANAKDKKVTPSGNHILLTSEANSLPLGK